MASENVVHIMLDYKEALRAKRDILSSEMSSLGVAKRIGRYRFLRLEELKLKTRIYGKIKETKTNLRKLQALIPEPKIPRILKRVKKEEEEAKGENKVLEAGNKVHDEEDIESQLRDIQRRLEELQV